MSSPQIANVLAKVEAGLSGLWDMEVDCFAVGVGLDEVICDESREDVISAILNAIKEASEVKKVKKVKKVKSNDEPVKKDESVKVKAMRKLTPYNVFVKTTLEDWRAENGKDQPPGGQMKYASDLWKESFMNPKSDHYDEARTAVEMENN